MSSNRPASFGVSNRNHFKPGYENVQHVGKFPFECRATLPDSSILAGGVMRYHRRIFRAEGRMQREFSNSFA
jgi:hypothetical protein